MLGCREVLRQHVGDHLRSGLVHHADLALDDTLAHVMQSQFNVLGPLRDGCTVGELDCGLVVLIQYDGADAMTANLLEEIVYR